VKPESRKFVANFMRHAKPIQKTWSETRLAFKFGGDIYLIEDNFPHWTTSHIIEFCRAMNLEVFDLNVDVTHDEETK
jgi:hypothetical protein